MSVFVCMSSGHTGFPFGAFMSNSGAIQPSVPGIPERRLKLW